MKLKVLFGIIVVLIYANLAHAQITVFNDSVNNVNLSYPVQFIDQPFFIRLPDGIVSDAKVRIEGFDVLGQAILPADIVLVTDVSGSMDDDCPLPGCKIEDAKVAALSFLDNVNLNYIHVGHVHYSYWGEETVTRLNTDIDVELTDSRSDLDDAINAMYANGWTNMGGGMELAMNELLSSRAQDPDRLYMVVMTDGMANCYPDDYNNYDLTDPNDGTCGSSGPGANYVRYVAQLCADNNITVYGIAFGSGANQALVDEIASLTGGTSHFAPDAATLADIYNQIAQSISFQDFPTPIISSTNPVSLTGWQYNTQYSLDTIWNNDDCGSAQASCIDFRNLLQQNIDICAAFPCDVNFTVFSSTFGTITLSDLYIEINEPPVGNFPPIGNCRYEPLICPETNTTLDIDDGSMVSDPNDDLDTLTWDYESSVQSPGGSYFDLNSDYNITREVIITVNPLFVDENFWEVFFFNISDPWGASTMACVNVSYEGCAECGNLIVESGEDCDDGQNGDMTDLCTDFCVFTFCGDNIVQSPNGEGTFGPSDDGYEQCDDGANGNDLDDCFDNCSSTQICGDGLVRGTEECDDGNIIANDDCTDLCLDAYCGDNVIWNISCTLAECEECDDGALNSDTMPDACRTNCINHGCGDSVVDSGEFCDDGANGDDLDGCYDDCTYTTVCGNGIQEDAEQCDDGIWNSDVIPDACRTDCHLPTCGDGVIDTGEVCDDGNLINGDGCDNSCNTEVVNGDCGDGDVDPGEDCDDGPLGSLMCTPWCEFSSCPDGIWQNPNYYGETEVCDDGNFDNDDFCRNDCTLGMVEDTVFTVENMSFNSIDLYDYVQSLWPPPERVLTILYSDPSPMIITLGTNSIKVTPPFGWIGSKIIYINLTDGISIAQLRFNFTVLPIPHYPVTSQDTRLLIAKGQLVTGYYEDALIGDIYLWGPYIITIKVWEK